MGRNTGSRERNREPVAGDAAVADHLRLNRPASFLCGIRGAVPPDDGGAVGGAGNGQFGNLFAVLRGEGDLNGVVLPDPVSVEGRTVFLIAYFDVKEQVLHVVVDPDGCRQVVGAAPARCDRIECKFGQLRGGVEPQRMRRRFGGRHRQCDGDFQFGGLFGFSEPEPCRNFRNRTRKRIRRNGQGQFQIGGSARLQAACELSAVDGQFQTGGFRQRIGEGEAAAAASAGDSRPAAARRQRLDSR